MPENAARKKGFSVIALSLFIVGFISFGYFMLLNSIKEQHANKIISDFNKERKNLKEIANMIRKTEVFDASGVRLFAPMKQDGFLPVDYNNRLDSWASPYKYCAWYTGTGNVPNGYLQGISGDLPGTYYFAIISGGYDRVIETECLPNKMPVAKRDDLVYVETYDSLFNKSNQREYWGGEVTNADLSNIDRPENNGKVFYNIESGKALIKTNTALKEIPKGGAPNNLIISYFAQKTSYFVPDPSIASNPVGGYSDKWMMSHQGVYIIDNEGDLFHYGGTTTLRPITPLLKYSHYGKKLNYVDLPPGLKANIVGNGGGASECLLSNGNKMYCNGYNSSIRPGYPGATSAATGAFAETSLNIPIKKIEVYGAYSGYVCGIDPNDDFYCIGSLGFIPGYSFAKTPVKLASNVKRAFISGYTFCMLTNNNELICGGDNPYGKAGRGTNRYASFDIIETSVLDATLGNDDGCLLKTNNELKCWGRKGLYGELPASFPGATYVPTTVPTPPGHNWVRVTSGLNYFCLLDDQGEVYCRGYNGNYSLGNGTNASTGGADVWTKVSTNVKFSEIRGGHWAVCGTEIGTGDFYCWGQLPNNTSINFSVPTLIIPGSGG